MNIRIEELLPQLTDFLKNEAKTDTVVGKEFKLGEFMVVPVIRLGLGFGSGGGEGDSPKEKMHGEGIGLGGGIGIEPIGFLVTRQDQISFIPSREVSGLSKAFEKVPGLIEKYMETRKMEATPA